MLNFLKNSKNLALKNCQFLILTMWTRVRSCATLWWLIKRITAKKRLLIFIVWCARVNHLLWKQRKLCSMACSLILSGMIFLRLAVWKWTFVFSLNVKILFAHCAKKTSLVWWRHLLIFVMVKVKSMILTTLVTAGFAQLVNWWKINIVLVCFVWSGRLKSGWALLILIQWCHRIWSTRNQLRLLFVNSLAQVNCHNLWTKQIRFLKSLTSAACLRLGQVVWHVSVPALKFVTCTQLTMVGFARLKHQRDQTLVWSTLWPFMRVLISSVFWKRLTEKSKMVWSLPKLNICLRLKKAISSSPRLTRKLTTRAIWLVAWCLAATKMKPHCWGPIASNIWTSHLAKSSPSPLHWFRFWNTMMLTAPWWDRTCNVRLFRP